MLKWSCYIGFYFFSLYNVQLTMSIQINISLMLILQTKSFNFFVYRVSVRSFVWNLFSFSISGFRLYFQHFIKCFKIVFIFCSRVSNSFRIAWKTPTAPRCCWSWRTGRLRPTSLSTCPRGSTTSSIRSRCQVRSMI